MYVKVVTDVEGSTLLWEWDAAVMAEAVEAHNAVLRGLLAAHGGHEVRTDGDSFVLAFHDATDAVAYCVQVRWYTQISGSALLQRCMQTLFPKHSPGRHLAPSALPMQAQEALLGLKWPSRLLEHPFCAQIHLGKACCRWQAAGMANTGLEQRGPLLMAGLRVRMGINTGKQLLDQPKPTCFFFACALSRILPRLQEIQCNSHFLKALQAAGKLVCMCTRILLHTQACQVMSLCMI